jgi:hypothetical protein
MQNSAMTERDQWNAGVWSVPELCDMAVRGLQPMLNAEKQIFCHSYRRTNGGMYRVGLSPRYTMMTLLGLHRYEAAGQRSPIAINPILNALLRDTRWIESMGDLGLLLWTCAELAPERIPEVYKTVQAKHALTQFPDGRLGCTMEVAWYLTGLTTCREAGFGDLPLLQEQTQSAKQILKRNCGVAGVYGHCSRGKLPTGYVRRRIGSFADQVYPTIALARLSLASNDQEAREMALRTANTMSQLQGSLGEWSWHYDSSTGRVVGRYPVFSVHQHAMAPMMLFAAGEASGQDFTEAISKGLAWIGGANELRRDFIQPEAGLVWRCIYLLPAEKYRDTMMRLLQIRSEAAGQEKVKIRYECRPYELGWFLYAFAGRCAR